MGFVTAWALGGALTNRGGYSPVHDTISQLAAVDANTRPLMTSGMVLFGLAVPAYALALRRTVPGGAWIAAAATGIATLGVAATPLDHSDLVDLLHQIAAGAGYVTLALVPVLARRSLHETGHHRLASFGTAMAVVSAIALPTSLVVEQTGFFQRLGLGAGDAFLIASVPAIRSTLAGLDSR